MHAISKYIWLLLCLLFSYYTTLNIVYPAQSFAQTVVFEDSFDESNQKWEVSRGSPSFWTVEHGQLIGTVPTTFTIAELVPSDEYWQDEWHDFTLEMTYVPVLGVDKNFSFFIQDVRNWYEFHFYAFGLELVAVQNGRSVWNKIYPEWLTYGLANTIRLEVAGDTISFSINGQEIVRESDPLFASGTGKIGLKLGAGSAAPTQAIIDDVKITIPGENIPPPDLEEKNASENLIHLSQWDPTWASLEYDSATTWSEVPTIGRWGCVITSLSMIFKAHGIVSLPDGTELNPATLNDWLLEEPDGYINGGYVNLPATTRIAEMLSKKIGTPKLEYLKHSANHEAFLREEFAAGNPSMVEIPGHFLVAHDEVISADGFDVAIMDPAFVHTKLSQHEEEIVSVRTFTPSFTDLSYLVIAAGEDIVFELTDPQGAIVPVHTFHLQDPLNPDTISPVTRLIELAKPDSGEYVLKIDEESSGLVQIFAYDTEARLTDLSFSADAESSPTTFHLLLSESGTAQFKPANQFTLTQIVHDLWQTQEITAFYAYEQLIRIAILVENASPEHLERYGLLFSYTVNHYTEFISDIAKEKISQYFEDSP